MKNIIKAAGEVLLKEEVYRLTGTLGTKTRLGGQILQAFKKEVEKKQTLEEVNTAWKKFIPKADKIIESFLKTKIPKNPPNSVKHNLKTTTWVLQKDIGFRGVIIELSDDFAVQLDYDQGDESRSVAKKVDAYQPSSFSPDLEIRDYFILNIHNKK